MDLNHRLDHVRVGCYATTPRTRAGGRSRTDHISLTRGVPCQVWASPARTLNKNVWHHKCFGHSVPRSERERNRGDLLVVNRVLTLRCRVQVDDERMPPIVAECVRVDWYRFPIVGHLRMDAGGTRTHSDSPARRTFCHVELPALVGSESEPRKADREATCPPTCSVPSRIRTDSHPALQRRRSAVELWARMESVGLKPTAFSLQGRRSISLSYAPRNPGVVFRRYDAESALCANCDTGSTHLNLSVRHRHIDAIAMPATWGPKYTTSPSFSRNPMMKPAL